MFRNRHILKSIADMVTSAAEHTIQDLRDGWVEQEAPFTDRLVANIQTQLDGKTVAGIRWKAKTLTDRGRHCQESDFGADFLGVLTLDLQGLRVTKGFFAQAKLIRRTSKGLPQTEFELLRTQCEKMLSVTPDSFVFLYSRRGIKIVPASSVVGTSAGGLLDLSNRTIGRFFVEYAECFIGDPKLNAPSLERFREVAERYNVRQGLYVHASDNGDLPEPQPRLFLETQAATRTTTTSPRTNQFQQQHQQRTIVRPQQQRIMISH